MFQATNRKNITIIAQLTKAPATDAGKINVKSLNIGFTPDEMIVRQITYNSAGGEVDASSIYWSALGQTIGFIMDPINLSPNTTFALRSFSGSTETEIQIKKPDNTIDTARDGALMLMLEFVEYQKPKN